MSADSTTDTIEIIGTKLFEATATLTSTQVTSVKVGDSADVQVDGLDNTITGTVTQVGPVQSSDDEYTYPVVVALPASDTGLFAGSTANISIVTDEVNDVLAVPTSAVIPDGTRSYVLMLSAGQLTEKFVTVGVVGYTYTQVTSGLTEGDSVVLADYSEAVPSSNTTTVGGFGGGFGGGLAALEGSAEVRFALGEAEQRRSPDDGRGTVGPHGPGGVGDRRGDRNPHR